jgi:hypothetical protein
MNMPAFAATRFVRPALRSIAVCFSIFLISSMALVSPAQAEGSVSAATAYWGGGNNSGYNCAGLSSLEAVQSCEVAKRQKWLADDLAYFSSWGTHPILVLT